MQQWPMTWLAHILNTAVALQPAQLSLEPEQPELSGVAALTKNAV